MQPVYEDFINRLEFLHDEMGKAIYGLNQQGLDWSPGHAMNSSVVLVVHTAGAERFWIGDVLGREPSHRDREAEFLVRGLDVDELLHMLADSLTYIRQVLDKLTLQDLESFRSNPRDGQQIRVGGILARVLGHTGIHTGQIQLNRQLWDFARANEEKSG